MSTEDGSAVGPALEDHSDGTVAGLAITELVCCGAISGGGYSITHIGSGRALVDRFLSARIAQHAIYVCEREWPMCSWTVGRDVLFDDIGAKNWASRANEFTKKP